MTDTEIVSKLMAAVPHGNTRTHTRESMPDRISYFISETVRQEQVIEKLEALLTANGIPLPE